jgi:hypothetical protein
MRNTEQTLSTAIGELRCLSPDSPAALAELTTLIAARECIDELLRACVDELRTDPNVTYSWSAIAYALGATSVSATRQRYGVGAIPANELVRGFWNTFAEQFVWDFLPTEFLYALYAHWAAEENGADDILERKAFTRRLKIEATADGDWTYTRSRPGSLMSRLEPLVTRAPRWERTDGALLYGLRRVAPATPASTSDTSRAQDAKEATR